MIRENFQVHISAKRRDRHVVRLLDIDRNSYVESQTVPLALTLGDPRSNSRSPRFQNLIFPNGAKLGPMLLLTINRKSYMGSVSE